MKKAKNKRVNADGSIYIKVQSKAKQTNAHWKSSGGYPWLEGGCDFRSGGLAD